MDALAVWCRRWLGAPPVTELFEAGNLSTVKGLRLADGREVVVKVRPRLPRLAGCAVVHRALWTAGFPCPEPLADLQPLDGYAATAETLVPDAGEPPPGRELAALSAAALARLVAAGPGPRVGAEPGSVAVLDRLGSHRAGAVACARRPRRRLERLRPNRGGWTASPQPSATTCATTLATW